MDIDNVFRQMAVDALVALIQYHEEEIESAHDRGAHVDVCSQRRFPVIPTANRVGSRQNTGSRIQRGLDAGFGNRYGLLLHGFVDGHLVGNVHFVKLVNGTDPIVREHERARFNGELARFFVLDHSSRKTCSGGSLARGVDRTGKK